MAGLMLRRSGSKSRSAGFRAGHRTTQHNYSVAKSESLPLKAAPKEGGKQIPEHYFSS